MKYLAKELVKNQNYSRGTYSTTNNRIQEQSIDFMFFDIVVLVTISVCVTLQSRQDSKFQQED